MMMPKMMMMMKTTMMMMPKMMMMMMMKTTMMMMPKIPPEAGPPVALPRPAPGTTWPGGNSSKSCNGDLRRAERGNGAEYASALPALAGSGAGSR